MSTYSSKLNALFIHVPRTAGTSVERILFPYTGGHETIREFDTVDDAFKFGFVRNPWDRFVSAFFCHPKMTSARFLDGFSMDKDGFNKYIDLCSQKLPSEYPREWPKVFYAHFMPMHHFLLDSDGKIGVDFVGRYESLIGDWKYVCDMLNVEEELPHHRESDHKHYEYYYTPESWDFVGNVYQRDISLFSYNGL